MKIAIASDIHLEFGDCELISDPADLLILAGDICVYSSFDDKVLDFFNKVSDQFKDIIYIMGNHEYYNSNYNMVLDSFKEKLKNLTNIHILDDERWGRFLCSTLWTNMNKDDPYTKMAARRGMTDFQTITFGDHLLIPEDYVKLFNKSYNFLNNNYQDGDIIVTHFLPTKQSCDPRYGNAPLNYCFYSDLDEFILSKCPPLWIHGHTHDSYDYLLDKTCILCNPRGYYKYETNSKIFHTKVVDI